MYINKKMGNIQENDTERIVFIEKPTYFPWDYFNWLWYVLFLATSQNLFICRIYLMA